MNIYDELENLKAEARFNPELVQALLATREMKNPVSAFCRIAQEHGCTFSAFDLVTAGRILTQRCVARRMVEARIRRFCREKMICTKCF